MIAETLNIRSFVVKTHLLRFMLFSDNKCLLFIRLGGVAERGQCHLFYRFFIAGLPLGKNKNSKWLSFRDGGGSIGSEELEQVEPEIFIMNCPVCWEYLISSNAECLSLKNYYQSCSYICNSTFHRLLLVKCMQNTIEDNVKSENDFDLFLRRWWEPLGGRPLKKSWRIWWMSLIKYVNFISTCWGWVGVLVFLKSNFFLVVTMSHQQDGNGDISFNEFVWLMTRWLKRFIMWSKW